MVLPDFEESAPATENFTHGFKFLFEAQRVVNIKKINGIMYCLMKWKNIDDSSYVKESIESIKIRCPSLMIEFFERNLMIMD